jgi:hypothetical protein
MRITARVHPHLCTQMMLAILPRDPTERRVLLILILMFVAGVALACGEVVRWWKARLAHYGPPPLAKLITFVRDPDRGWRATHVLWLPLT